MSDFIYTHYIVTRLIVGVDVLRSQVDCGDSQNVGYMLKMVYLIATPLPLFPQKMKPSLLYWDSAKQRNPSERFLLLLIFFARC